MIRYFLDAANLITTLGMLLGLASMYLSSIASFASALSCALLAVCCDVFDGMVARRFRRSPDALMQQIGVQLDSLADLVHSALAPGAFVFFFLDRSLLGAGLGLAMAVAGLWRLAYFNCAGLDEQGRFYGLPIFYSPMLLFVAFGAAHMLGSNWPMVLYAVATPISHLRAGLRIPKLTHGASLGVFLVVLFSELATAALLSTAGIRP